MCLTYWYNPHIIKPAFITLQSFGYKAIKKLNKLWYNRYFGAGYCLVSVCIFAEKPQTMNTNDLNQTSPLELMLRGTTTATHITAKGTASCSTRTEPMLRRLRMKTGRWRKSSIAVRQSSRGMKAFSSQYGVMKTAMLEWGMSQSVRFARKTCSYSQCPRKANKGCRSSTPYSYRS